MTDRPQNLAINANSLTFDALALGPETAELVLFLHGFPEFADAWLPILDPVAAAGYRAVAFDQRGYSPSARPTQASDYNITNLVSDVLACATELGAKKFHLVGHDWGGMVAWKFAADHPDRLHSLAVLSTPHPTAFLDAVHTDSDQQDKSRYIKIFRMPGNMAETALLADNAQRLRMAYQDKLPAAQIENNVRRLSEPGALTAALNWYRALDLNGATEKVKVPTLYFWGQDDFALGETAALATAQQVTGPYKFERLAGKSHWLINEATGDVTRMLLAHVKANAS